MTARTMNLSTLLDGWIDVPAPLDRPVAAISLDSRFVEPGALFIALAGRAHDGRAFAADAIARGAACVLSETGVPYMAGPVPVFVCSRLKSLVGPIAARFYGEPSHQLQVIGVTGTNGKTTVTHALARALGTRMPCGVMGTLGNGFPDALTPSPRTTPDAVTLHRWLARFRDEGVAVVASEVSSHALDQERVGGVRFAGAIFTNLTRDHLDYHPSMAEYGAAKAKLFATAGLRFAVLNADDPFCATLAALLDPSVEVWWYGVTRATVRIQAIETLPHGLRLRLATPKGDALLESALFGDFNAHNLAAVLCALLALGWHVSEAVAALATVGPVPGRMERFLLGPARPLVVVDYAHTPDALEQALKAARQHTAAAVWCVFGCGGDRDQGKRPLMGACASRLADHVIVTHDNPRHEDPARIVADILAGIGVAQRPHVTVIEDRQEAIRYAVDHAGARDVVLVAGKGHEDYQQFGDACVPYSDRRTVQHLAGVA
ncbi:MAG: UDP-N-acetylmuramoyl-L-alanyl-D-glutamate--2,6-diaminopimelate ligase [Gammaproteobacteria bacterium]|nr:UDP-N-acetylmuramoyl-L-alanyl-D-glutamate--2,6-diaminopimelate ligase [Gammaproteobacteria bacterium]